DLLAALRECAEHLRVSRVEHDHDIGPATSQRTDAARVLRRILDVLGDQDVVPMLMERLGERSHKAPRRAVRDALDPDADQVRLTGSQALAAGVLLVVQRRRDLTDALTPRLRDSRGATEGARSGSDGDAS